MNRSQTILRSALAGALLSCVLLLSGCIEAPPPRPSRVAPPPPMQPPPPPPSEVFAYPQHGQTPEQQERDHFECSTWATQQTGFNPSAPGVPPQQRVQVVSGGPPSGVGTAIGAATGAIFGAAVSNSWQRGAGALAGAVVGGAIGNAADQSNAQQTRTVVVQDRRGLAFQDQQVANYRRAIGACLDARGYSVQ
jgi:hypothetical protein